MIQNHSIYNPGAQSLLDSLITDKLYCDFELDLNGQIVQLKSIELSSMIAFLLEITKTTTNFGRIEYSFELIGSSHYILTWHRDSAPTYHIISISNSQKQLASARIWTGHFHNLKESYFLKLIGAFLDLKMFNFANKYGQMFYTITPVKAYKFQIADKVKAALNENVKTEREGYVIGMWYHENEKSNMYHLMINSKKYKKRYFEEDLVLID